MNASSVSAALEDSVIMASGAPLRIVNNTDFLTVNSTSEYNSYEILPTDRSCDCERDTERTFFAAFIATLLLSLALFLILVITGIVLKTRNCLIKSLSKNSPDSGINLGKYPSNEVTVPLLGYLKDCGPCVALERMIGLVSLSLRAKTLLHKNLIAEINRQFELKLTEMKQDTRDQETQLGSSKKAELKRLEMIFSGKMKKSNSGNWDKVKQILEQIRTEKEKLINVKYQEKVYNLQHHDDVQKLHFKISTERQNREFGIELNKLARETLEQWRKIVNNNEGMNPAALPSILFLLLEGLLQDELNHVNTKHGNQLQNKGNKYLRDLEKLQENFTKKCVDLETCYKENCNSIIRDQDRDLASSPWNEGKLMEQVKELYDFRTQILDVKLSLDMKKTQDKYSEVTLKLRHLDSAIQLQNEHLEDLEKVITLIIKSQKIYVQVLIHLHKGTELKIDGQRQDTEMPWQEEAETVDS
ncbi:repetitive organellar protein [Procambarus clarkii]|uniref:repetitive organellar protein n=1 Tax=Procambarus clarkii TaxID=6728 RepID=UPI003742F506